MQQEGTLQERFINEAVPNQSTSCDENYESQTLLEPTLESEISFERETSSEFEIILEPETLLEPEALLEPETPSNSLFQCNQGYASLEAFKYVADQFAETSKFKVIFLKGNNYKDGLRSAQVFACDRYGVFKPKPKDPNKKNRNKESKKCNCPWSVRLNYNKDDNKYYISQVNLHHNHKLIPLQLMHILPANHEISGFIKEEILTTKKAGIAILQIQSLLTMKYETDVYNLVDADHTLRNEFQAHDFLLLLQQKHNNDPEFSYKFELDKNDQLKHVIWVYAAQKRQYMHFHDMIVYDNTYKSNYFLMPFGVFTGITNNGLSYCAADTLLHDETSSSFKWLFKAFIHIFGTAPNTILTDNDLMMADAIRSVLTNKYDTKHGLCIWHMKCIIKNENYAEAQSYLGVLSRWRERWASAYLKDYFFADMSSKQKGESMNSFLKGFVDCKTRLTEFLAAFKHALYFREEAEHISAYKELVYPIPSDFPNPIENQAASCLMRYAWKKFEAEWSEKDAYACEKITNDNGMCCFKLSRYERPDVIRRVYYDGKVLACCCCNLEFARIVCRHSLAVAVRLSLAQLDPVHFPKHWQKDLPKLELAKDYVNFYSHTQPQDPGTLASHESFGEGDSRIRFMHIHRLSGEIANKIATIPINALYDADNDFVSTHENASAFPEHPIINNPIKSKA
ncbi:16358_t:CDS:2, partial [Cetraspora pellucida]